MASPEKVLYSAEATSTGGRAGTSKSSDGVLDLVLTTPKGLGGDGARGTNPEQLFASGYSACFIGALKVVGGQKKTPLPADTQVTAKVGIGPIAHGFGIRVDMAVHIPGWEKDKVEEVIKAAHEICPYSNATRGNIDVNFTVA